MDKRITLKAYTAGVVFAILVGFSFLAVRVSVQISLPIEVLVFRYNFAFIFVCVTAAVFKSARLNVNGKKKPLFFSALCYVLFMVLQTIGLVFATSVESAIMFAIVPIVAKIIAKLLLSETSTWKQNVFMGMSVSAVIYMLIMSAGDVNVNLIGIILLMLSSICLAATNVLIRYVRTEHNRFSVTFANSMFGFAVLNIGYVIYLIREHGNILSYFAPCANPEFILAAAYLGIPCIAITTWLMGYMMKHMEAIRGIIFGNLASAVSIVAGIIILGEHLTFYHIICTIAIVVGVIGVSATAKKI